MQVLRALIHNLTIETVRAFRLYQAVVQTVYFHPFIGVSLGYHLTGARSPSPSPGSALHRSSRVQGRFSFFPLPAADLLSSRLEITRAPSC